LWVNSQPVPCLRVSILSFLRQYHRDDDLSQVGSFLKVS
jgi:hypothetical protein